MKDDLSHRLARASAHLDAGFATGDVERSLADLTRRIQRQQRARRAVLAASLAALMAVGWVALRTAQQAPVARQGALLRTRDGSLASALEADTVFQLQHDGEREVSVSLVRGAGHFAVTKQPTRRYRVHAGAVDVLVLGTVFDVVQRGARTQVSVSHGAVQVGWASGQTILRAGQSDWFPRPASPAQAASLGSRAQDAGASSLEQASAEAYAAEAASAADPSAAVRAVASHAGSRAEAPHASTREAWRTLARAGKHGAAFRSLDRAPVEDLEGLLLAADTARLSGHPRDAASYLERLVERYPESAPARLGAFTLAGLQLHELHDPGRAARSYARAYQLDPEGPLAPDALAREAEAYARAGQHQSARRAAERYLARYPEGVRRGELQRYLDE